jgi:hypothetical protein
MRMAALPERGLGAISAAARLDYILSQPADFGSTEDAMAVATATKPDDGKPDRKHNIEAMRRDYYERIAKRDMAPLWTDEHAHPRRAGDPLQAGHLALR